MDGIDQAIARWMADHRASPLTHASRFLEDLGSSLMFVGVAGLVGLGLIAVHRAWSAVPQVVVAVLVTGIVTRPLKEIFDRPRPSGDLTLTTLYEPAMPSSHAILTSSVVVAVLLAPWWKSVLWRRVATVAGVAGCVVVAAAMVYLGGHWVSDILVGWLLGVTIAAAVMIAWQRWIQPPQRVDANRHGVAPLSKGQ